MLRSKSVFMLFLLSCSPALGENEGILLDRILPPSTLKRYRDADYPEQMKIIRRTIQNTCTRLKVQVARNEQDEYLRRLKELKTLGDDMEEMRRRGVQFRRIKDVNKTRLKAFIREKARTD